MYKAGELTFCVALSEELQMERPREQKIDFQFYFEQKN
jgi:hypothetical protein